MERRNFLHSLGTATLGAALISPRIAPHAAFQAAGGDRRLWVDTLVKVAQPLLGSLAIDRLKAEMPVEVRTESLIEARRKFVHLEGFARLLCGIAPWLEMQPDDSAEGNLRERFFRLSHLSLANAVNPEANDFMNFCEGSQPLVDAAFLCLALLRVPRIWKEATPETRRNIVEAMKRTRPIQPHFNNWLLFSALIETFLRSIGEDTDVTRIEYALRQHEQWYKGDGVFGDGPDFHWDYYNSFVIQPFLRTILLAMGDPGYDVLRDRFSRIAARYSVVLERLVAEDGSFPALGRSMAYRCGAFHHLANEALHGSLPDVLAPAQVRCALTAVIRKTLTGKANYDRGGWLRIGLSGSQRSLAEDYISTGSLYLCATVFLPLGLPPQDPFWSSPAEQWTAQKAWNGSDVQRDSALKF